MNKLLMQSQFSSSFYYRVESYDDINKIADSFNTTPAIIIAENNLTEQIKEGQLLYISVIKGNSYIVQPQDTLESLAEYDNQKLLAIKNKNMIDSIYVGQKLIL